MQNIHKNDTSECAFAYQSKNQIEEWIHLFLNSEGNNSEFSIGLKKQKRFFSNTVEIDTIKLERNTGPELDKKYNVTKASFENKIDNIKKLIKMELIFLL